MGNSALKQRKLNLVNFISSGGLEIGGAGVRGHRPTMEDRHLICDVSNHTIVAVFDGHGGSGAAQYASENFVSTLEQNPIWKSYITKTDGHDNETDPKTIGDALISVFEEIDIQLRIKQSEHNFIDSSGCTACVTMITPYYIICANAGDSRCILGSLSVTLSMSNDHKPTNFKEKNRIVEAGGCVQNNRVDGNLAVSRALGDFFSKEREDLPARSQKVSCIPEIIFHKRTDGDEVIILACDGLWDVMTSNEVLKFVRKKIFKKGILDPRILCEELIDNSLRRGTQDNVSVIVVKLPGLKTE
mmetsp:Transcript_14587/g.14697  ORF Transcript_14587/g.14697 Transcript_14587/m.14697 type:complete len:301 (+) Transcript_14587:354-1256(+)